MVSTLKNRNLNYKLDLFLNIINEDGNDILSFDEVYSISINSLMRQMETKNKKNPEKVVYCIFLQISS